MVARTELSNVALRPSRLTVILESFDSSVQPCSTGSGFDIAEPQQFVQFPSNRFRNLIEVVGAREARIFRNNGFENAVLDGVGFEGAFLDPIVLCDEFGDFILRLD